MTQCFKSDWIQIICSLWQPAFAAENATITLARITTLDALSTCVNKPRFNEVAVMMSKVHTTHLDTGMTQAQS